MRSPGETFGLTPAHSLLTWSDSPVRPRDQSQGHKRGLHPAEAHNLSTLREPCLCSAARCPAGGAQHRDGRGIYIRVICIVSCRWQQRSHEFLPSTTTTQNDEVLLSCMENGNDYRRGDGKSRLFWTALFNCTEEACTYFLRGETVDSMPCNSWLKKK